MFFYLHPTPNTKQSSWTWQNKVHGLALPVSFSFRSPNHTFLFIPVHLPVISTNILLHYSKLQKEITVTCCMVCKVNRKTQFINMKIMAQLTLYVCSINSINFDIQCETVQTCKAFFISYYSSQYFPLVIATPTLGGVLQDCLLVPSHSWQLWS